MPSEDARYRQLREQGLVFARQQVETKLEHGPKRVGQIWPEVLETAHIRHLDFTRLLAAMREEGRVAVEDMTPRDRTIKDRHLLRLSANA